MNLLALIMIEGYHRSEEKDKQNGTYNPFISETWDYKLLRNKIIQSLKDNNYFNFLSLDDLIWK